MTQRWQILLNNKLWRTIESQQQPPMNKIIEWIDQERYSKSQQPETNLDQEFRLDLSAEIIVRLEP